MGRRLPLHAFELHHNPFELGAAFRLFLLKKIDCILGVNSRCKLIVVFIMHLICNVSRILPV